MLPQVQYLTKLTEVQKGKIRSLAACCQKRDHISLSFPLDPEDGPVSYYWMSDGQGRLMSALSLNYWENHLAECIAFTHPDFRRKGYFSQLLDKALESCEEDDLLFPASNHCADTMATLEALQAEFQFREHLMELDFAASLPIAFSPQKQTAVLKAPKYPLSPNALWTIHLPLPGSHPVGSCQTSPAAPGCLCLHHLEVHPGMRRQGLGFSLACQLLCHIQKAGVCRAILQVSGQNQAALALYKKTGFQTTETLSYYLL